MKIYRQLKNEYTNIPIPIKLFSLLILSAIVVQFSAWALDWKFGQSLYILSEQTIKFSDLLNPSQDGGYLESFRYILLIWCFILSAIWVVGRKYFQIIYIPLIYFYLFLDDAFCIHDRLAGVFISEIYIENSFLINDYIRIKDFAELTYWFLILIIILIIYSKSFKIENINIKKFIKYNFFLFLGMAFFGVFIDLIEANWFKWIKIESENILFIMKLFISLFEALGEIVVISIACVWLFSKNFSSKQIRNFV